MGKQGVQQGAKHTPLRGPHIEGQRSRGVVDNFHLLVLTRHEVQDPVAKGGVQFPSPELGGHYGVEG